MRIDIPEKVAYIISELKSHDFEAYAVGGCVRDAILGRVPEDWDITTSAKPEELKQIFSRTVDTGIEHGTVTVLLGSDSFEMTTYRLDGEYEDCRHPKEVSFTRNLREDLCRRDFTINAMAYNEEEGLIDLFDGKQDIENKVIRCVGSAEKRFEEDALRILRAVRFSAQLGFEIDEETYHAAAEKAKNLRHISAERIREELSKLLVSKHPDRLMVAYEIGITGIVLPEFDVLCKTYGKESSVSFGSYTIQCIHKVNELTEEEGLEKKQRLMLAYTMLLHNMKTPAKKLLQELRFDNETIHTVTHLIQYLDAIFESSLYGMRQAANQIGKDYMSFWFLVRKARLEASDFQNKDDKYELVCQEEKSKSYYDEVLRRNDCTNLKELAVCGSDLIELGMKPGKQLGEMLNKLLQKVLEEPQLNEKEKLLQMVQDEKPIT